MSIRRLEERRHLAEHRCGTATAFVLLAERSFVSNPALAFHVEFQQAVELFQAGCIPQALAACRVLLSQNPHEARVHRLLGLIALRMGNLAVGVECLARAVAAQPDEPGNVIDLSIALQMSGKLEAALAVLTSSVTARPQQGQVWERFGEVLELCGRHSDALDAYIQASRRHPDSFAAHNNAANLLNAAGRHAEAERHARRALEMRPRATEAANNLGNALQGQGQTLPATEAYRRALDCDPHNAQAAYNLGLVWESRSSPQRAIQCYRKALEISPKLHAARNNLGVALLATGDSEQARRELALALQSNRDDDAIRSNYLLAHQYAPDVEPEALRRLHIEWAPPDRTPSSNTQPDPATTCSPAPHFVAHAFHRGRPLRVGFVSGDFARHPVGYFLAPVLEHLRRHDVVTVCYSNSPDRDDMTHRIEAAAHLGRNIFRQPDDRVAAQIAADGIDVLIDLSGHTGGNRLPLFARRAAAIQATWLGYAGTTGLANMDYLICDRYHVPPELEPFHSERPLRLAEGYACFEPPADAPLVSPLPAAVSGTVTFGCFNNPVKINPPLARVWGRVLAAVPSSRLVLKYRGLDTHAAHARLGRMLSDQGIALERVTFLGGGNRTEFLAGYQAVDLALDTAPYSGGLSTCEALWMGVPVLTCPGHTFASRHSLSHLTNAGLPDTIATDADDVVRLASSWAGDLGRLGQVRSTLRERMLAAPLCDAETFTSDLVARFENVVRGEAAPSGVK